MEVIIGIILALCILFGAGYFMRKNIYKDVDKLESWKIEIMNRSIIDEMSKVKDLKMDGQTEELFEEWRNEWDEIITTQLPKVEELLFEVEDCADKYRFKKGKEILNDIREILTEVDTSIDKIIYEINELVSSEKKNSVESEEVKQQFKKVKKTIIAHSHLYGNARHKLEEDINEVFEKLKQFDIETKNGNYLAARDLLTEQKEKLDLLTEKVEEIPKLMSECNSVIPNQIQELKDGFREMVEEGYYLDHIQFEAEMERLNEQLEYFRKKLLETDVSEVKEKIVTVQELIDNLYDLLEKEVHANHYLKKAAPEIEGKIIQLMDQQEEASKETEAVKQSYHLSEQDIKGHKIIEKQILQLAKRYELIKQNLQADHIAHTIIKEELEDIENQIEQLQIEHTDYYEMLQALRKDELLAREKLQDLKHLISETSRAIQKSNVPGLPEPFVQTIDFAKINVQKVTMKLNQIPLNMTAVNLQLEEAVDAVEALKKDADEMIEQVYLVEKVIQYGNRYRNRNQNIADKLEEAEALFRNYEYGESLETAAAALERVEPGSIERIQAIIEQEQAK
ncbi:septation ring formation regulator EzrA [Metabacillus fastidiosus]|uniref:septation ring formation regulator EzrA n=1 Tax=Metabacillus fastidiosus TaxID=1458 RepID=UPI002E2153DC|nr:septation ring formation regulator EzrA [Metabacillus fastidiosus]